MNIARRSLSLAFVSVLAACAAATSRPDAIGTEPSIAGAREAFGAHRYAVRDLVHRYVARIDAIDRKGPALHAVLAMNPQAGQIAARLDATSVKDRGALFGVPVLIKDNIDTVDLPTTAGSLALVSSKPSRDAFIVKRLREAGAIILGKTNLSEWANLRSSASTSGWSAVGGLTRNPYGVERNACGSSSGSGAAIAADLAIVAVGTETDGSITCPASVNGVVGIKPTVGLVSRSGIVPISAVQDTAGPMARSVADAAALLTVLAGYDPDDPATASIRDRAPIRYEDHVDARALKGARIGVARKAAGFHEGVDVVFEHALQVLREQGAILIDPADIEKPAHLDENELTALEYEFKDGINRYLATRTGSSPRSLAELIAFNDGHKVEEMPYFGQDLFIAAQKRGSLDDKAYRNARRATREVATRLDALFARHHLDALVAPTVGPAWMTDLVNGDHFSGGGIIGPAAIAGVPHISVPMGFVQGLPVGLSLVGRAWSEQQLIGYAYGFEQASHARVAPASSR